jgi:hypothetical protein
LVVWLLALFLIRYGLGLSTFDSTAVDIFLRFGIGLIVASMGWAGISLVKAPGAYTDRGNVRYVERKLGPHPLDFWIVLAIGIAAGLSA